MAPPPPPPPPVRRRRRKPPRPSIPSSKTCCAGLVGLEKGCLLIGIVTIVTNVITFFIIFGIASTFLYPWSDNDVDEKTRRTRKDNGILVVSAFSLIGNFLGAANGALLIAGVVGRYHYVVITHLVGAMATTLMLIFESAIYLLLVLTVPWLYDDTLANYNALALTCFFLKLAGILPGMYFLRTVKEFDEELKAIMTQR